MILMSFMWSGDWQPYDEQGRRKYVNETECQRFLAAAETLTPDMRALCYLLSYTGCRISEALALRHDQIDRDSGAVLIRTLKRRRLAFRNIPIPPFLLTMLLAITPCEDGRLWNCHRTTAWRQVRRAMDSAKIKGPMSCPKGLRHGFGIRCATGSVPPNLIQRWMGHASIETTAIYIDAVGLEERHFAERLW